MRDIIENELKFMRNRDSHADNLLSNIEKELNELVFEGCCSVVKQVQAGIPVAETKKWFVEQFKKER